jgi:HAMP domain-containing protein
MAWQFHLNFYVVSIVIISVFNLLISFFILFRIPAKTSATKHMGLAFLGAAFLAIGFFPGYALDHPLMAMHRYITIPATLFNMTELGQALYHFPKTVWRRLAKTMQFVQYSIIVGITAWFIVVTTGRNKVFSFSGHYWDFDADNESLIVGAVILLFILHLIFAGVLNAISSKGFRKIIFALIGCAMIATLIPSVTNVLSREGAIERDVHQTVLILCSITGFFSMLMVYLNNVDEKTTFMVKIVGISLVLFMVVMVFISYFSFQDREEAYDVLHAEQTSRLAIQPGYAVKDLSSLRLYNLKDRSVNFSPTTAVDWDEVENFSLHEKIANLSSEKFATNLAGLLSSAPVHFSAYKNLLLDLSRRHTTAEALLQAADRLQGRIRHRAEKIAHLPEQNFAAELKKYVGKLPSPLSAFRQAILACIESPPTLAAPALKAEVLRIVKPFYGRNARQYRLIDTMERYTAFLSYSPEKQAVTEALYHYEGYRAAVHAVGFKLSVIFLAVTVVILAGFRIFFLGILIRPLEALLGGVDRVNRGDFDVEIKPGIADEIGFLTRSFNGMVTSIKFARQKLKDHADHLEEKVEERTTELRTTLNEVQLLKQQQDGDYFLTSLLIKPLAQNRAGNARVQVDFLIEQKKKFTFRKWQDEIGGDFCTADSVKLKDRNYTLFINADAMGKSIQGAGGALVLGAVFESILDRTRTVPAFYQQSPERWLKNVFEELQTVFESFDGSMLVSMVLGLLDDETGLVYYINAEHPWTVLYRDNKAEFIEREFAFRKLGVSGIGGQLYIKTLQLKPKDVLILGSDGRDDLRINSEEAAGLINEDENLFLRNVEAGNGELPQIYTQLTQTGELTDDLSLIRVAYLSGEHGNEPAGMGAEVAPRLRQAKKSIQENDQENAASILQAILAENPRHLPAMKMLVRILVHAKDYERALDFAEDYVILRPADTNMLFLVSTVCKRLGKYQEAIEYGERVRLRAPEFVINLVHLASLYSQTGNKRRAAKLAEEALRADPQNERAKTYLASVIEA